MAALTAHQQRIKDELAAAGMSSYGQHKMSSRYLPKVMAEDEHIKGVVYGHSGTGLALLVATERRIIYVERRPLFASVDEVSYEVVVGVRYIKVGLFPAVELHTRMGNYTLNYVNTKCARKFIEYIENRIEHLVLDHTDEPHPKITDDTATPALPSSKSPITDDARDFLRNHEVAVLSTADRTGSIQGVAIYYLIGNNDKIYLMTKSDTAKAHSMLANHQVALTVFDADEAKTMQLQGYAEIEADPATKQTVFDYLTKPRNYNGQQAMPPVTQLEAGGFIVFRITPITANYSDYLGSDGTTPA